MINSFPENNHEYNRMTLTGQGEVTVAPDIAVIRLGVETIGNDLTTIQEDNAKLSQAILNTLNLFGVSDIKTFQYVIEKIYDYENNTRIDKGYSVRNIFEIRLTDMDQVGAIIDAAVEQGANVVDLISFEVTDMDSYYLEALNLAILNALQKAKSIADELSISVEPIPIRIIENSRVPEPLARFSSVREIAFTTPIESGKKRIEAVVTVEFEY